MKEIEKLTPKEEFIRAFNEQFDEEFFPKEWDQDKRDRLTKLTSNSRTKTTMFTSIPMTCQGRNCMFADTCPVLREDLAPIGKPCPIELGFVKHFMADYMEEMDVSPDNLVELSMIRGLVDLEVQYLRKTKVMAKESFIQEYVVGMDPDGDPIFGKQLHVGVEFEDKIHKKQQTIFKVMLASREMKAKVGIAAFEAQTMSDLSLAAQNIRLAKEKELKQKLGYVDQDDYIEVDSTEE